MEFLWMIVLIMMISLVLSNIIHEKTEETIPMTVMGMVILVYIFGILGVLKIGVYAVIIISMIAGLYLIIKLINRVKKKKVKEKIKEIVTPGIVVYIVLYIIFIIMNQKKIFIHHDEFSHWGLIIKNMYLYNDFGTNIESIVQYNEYPPFTAIFQYLFLIFKNEYSETTIITASNILYISIMIIYFKRLTWKNINKIVLYVLIILFLPLTFFSDFYDTILVDGLLATFFAYIIYNWYTQRDNRKYKIVTVSLGIISLSLTKLSGIALSILIILLILGDIIINNRKKKNIIDIAIIIMILTLFISSWFIKLNVTNTEKKWQVERINIKSIYEIVNKQDEKENIKNFVKGIFSKNVITQRNLTMLEVVIIILAISIIVGKNEEEIKKYRYYQISLILSILFYSVGLVCTYLFLIPNEEARQMASYDRYIGTILLGNLMFFFAIWSNQNRKINNKVMLVVTLLLLSIFPTSSTIVDNINSKNKRRNQLFQRKINMDILKYEDILNKNDKVYYFSNQGKEQEKDLLMARYMMMPLKIENTNMQIKNVQNFRDILENENYTYVYLFYITEEFKKEYKDLFKEEVKQKTMYKKYKNEDKIYLLEV